MKNKSTITKATLAALEHVTSMVPQADAKNVNAPMWYGWALREAFEAGVKWELERKEIETQQPQ